MEIVKGDIIKYLKENKVDFIAHQCNCVVPSYGCGGVARAIFKAYPETAQLYDWYLDQHKLKYGNTKEALGTFCWTEKDKVINIFSQYHPGMGTTDEEDIDYDENRLQYLISALKGINENESVRGKKIAFPLIASGLAKSERYKNLKDSEYFQAIIQPILEEYLTNLDVIIIEYGKDDSKVQ